MEDDPHTGWPVEVMMLENIAVTEKLLKESRCITYRRIEKLVQIDAPTIYRILQEHLHISGKSVPCGHSLTEEQKVQSIVVPKDAKTLPIRIISGCKQHHY